MVFKKILIVSTAIHTCPQAEKGDAEGFEPTIQSYVLVRLMLEPEILGDHPTDTPLSAPLSYGVCVYVSTKYNGCNLDTIYVFRSRVEHQ